MTDFAKSSKLGTDISNVLISGVSMEKLDTEALNKYAGWLAVTVVVRNQVTGGDLTNVTAADVTTVMGTVLGAVGATFASSALLVVAGVSTVADIIYGAVLGSVGITARQ